jgi:integrase
MTPPAASSRRRTRALWPTAKAQKQFPKGLHQRADGRYQILFRCGRNCRHEIMVGTVKTEALRLLEEHRLRRRREPDWCPRHERSATQAADQARASQRIRFRAYVDDTYMPWCTVQKAGWMNERAVLRRAIEVIGEKRLGEITTVDITRVLDTVVPTRAKATWNRYRDALSAALRRAVALGLISVNPVTGIKKHREAKRRRFAFLSPDGHEEAAVHDALPPQHRALFLTSIHSGIRWSEQRRLRWRDVNLDRGVLTVEKGKNLDAREVPLNSIVRRVLTALAARRPRRADPDAGVFPDQPDHSARFFPAAIERAQAALRDASHYDAAAQLEGYVWHCNRHSCASRLIMAGVDPATVVDIMGWRTAAMVQTYLHLMPGHRAAAMERLVRNSGKWQYDLSTT